MINSEPKFELYDTPYPHHVISGLISAADLGRLNAEVPSWDLFRRLVKEGAEHDKHYRMWLMDLYDERGLATGTEKLPEAWGELLADLLAPEFARTLSAGLGVDLDGLGLTLGIYRYVDGDYTSVSLGKSSKVVHLALYLNDSWTAEEGGHMHLWSAGDAAEPAKSIVPVGGTAAVMSPSDRTWHNIGEITTGSDKDRINIMVEYWRN